MMPMKVLGLGTLINLILDPIFIYYFAIKGAALATVISQIIVFLIFIYLMIYKKHNYISLNLNNFKFNLEFEIRPNLKFGFEVAGEPRRPGTVILNEY